MTFAQFIASGGFAFWIAVGGWAVALKIVKGWLS